MKTPYLRKNLGEDIRVLSMSNEKGQQCNSEIRNPLGRCGTDHEDRLKRRRLGDERIGIEEFQCVALRRGLGYDNGSHLVIHPASTLPRQCILIVCDHIIALGRPYAVEEDSVSTVNQKPYPCPTLRREESMVGRRHQRRSE